MYAKNVSAFLIHLLKDGALRVNVDDPIIGETLLTRGGDVVHPRVREFCSLPPVTGSRSA